jgi:hypothetical protein
MRQCIDVAGAAALLVAGRGETGKQENGDQHVDFGTERFATEAPVSVTMIEPE